MDKLLGEDVAKKMFEVTTAIANIQAINIYPCCGLKIKTQTTRTHQHTLGVLNLLFGQRSQKEWYCWPPSCTKHTRKSALTLTQRVGDVLWLPPGAPALACTPSS